MVSFWPWKGDDNSAASFEKTLSTLSTKIAEATTRLDQQRQSSRRIKALWTLYSTFAYLFYSIILALVLGWESWGVKEYAAIAGGPALCVCPEVNLHVPTSLTPGLRIYGVRTLSSRVFDYRISRLQRRLDDFNKQREETIEKLKIATKYNSTQQLLEKYGGESPKPSPGPKGQDEKGQPVQQPQHVARTGLPPPPTANIRRPISASQTQNDPPSPDYPSPPIELAQGGPQTPQQSSPSPPFPPQTPTDQASFAPNAFPPQSGEQLHWYDRLLDVLLGEDETQPRNRMVMMCSACRLVNGQAPPGIKTPEELGRWRCGSCQAWNGVESETTKILSSLRQDAGPPEGTWEPVPKAEADTQYSGGMEEGVMVASGEEEQVDSVGSDAEDQKEESKPAPVRRSKRGATGNKA
ncbi:unnamed protein product [Penicillium nalgiovense]|uniref:Endoplasmic reticulum junction formation protein lunapark n=1 Tax=Penicillium nalgiovense TaxID=60175 RepID=A0A9W4I6S0_PENNA|nr:unnamed protein product [Penicillium nalgiovense]CAG8005985.1 unnamed protein product [Penicillium nalgiovense]CAG8014538.1 unnamed protein product [Penicillium nalgiovense]CAG8036562.1 unnamed protein product [Penicillium nalgiovense]CAG8050498.1 unnamed protein product [Penicillium nalgiovense]